MQLKCSIYGFKKSFKQTSSTRVATARVRDKFEENGTIQNIPRQCQGDLGNQQIRQYSILCISMLAFPLVHVISSIWTTKTISLNTGINLIKQSLVTFHFTTSNDVYLNIKLRYNNLNYVYNMYIFLERGGEGLCIPHVIRAFEVKSLKFICAHYTPDMKLQDQKSRKCMHNY